MAVGRPSQNDKKNAAHTARIKGGKVSGRQAARDASTPHASHGGTSILRGLLGLGGR